MMEPSLKIKEQLSKQEEYPDFELQAGKQTVEKFIYSLSHEFRGPVKSILGLVNLLSLSMKTPAERDCLKHISDSASRLEFIMDELMRELTTVSKIQEPITLRHEVEVVLGMYETQLKEAQINVKVETDQHTPFYTDSDRLKLVLQNLISNAIQFSDNNKRERHIFIGIQVSAHSSIITIADNGIGIDEQLQSKIFNPFFRATDQSKGVGLGLYISKNILQKMGGAIRLESNQGLGSAFVIEVPNHPPHHQSFIIHRS